VSNQYDIAVIGGGAAGFFAAIHAAEGGKHRVVILEKTAKLLTKVGVSGGGRCNVTHDCPYPGKLVQHYPRGGKRLKKPFEIFNATHTREWFESRGVALKTESDGRVFPVTDQSQTIIDCLQKEAESAKVEIRIRAEVEEIVVEESDRFSLLVKGMGSVACRKVIVTAGGFSKPEGYQWLARLGIKIVPPVPSLFTFNVPDSDLKDLMGLSVPRGYVQVPGSKWKEDGPILITHWGFSAPAVIKLSAWAAIDLHSRNYSFPILINWTGLPEEEVRETLQDMRVAHSGKRIAGFPRFEIPSRLWERLCAKAGIDPELRHADLPAKKANKFLEMLIRCPYQVNGKTTFKEEFVTCGGVDLEEINLKRFESKKIPGLYFAGEVLNVDGVTGGFNFQHAWTSGFLAGTAAAGDAYH
jgi:predicted Rossmann fold flavoprotein